MTTYETTRGTDYRVTFPRVLRSEWCKLWSLRSTWYALGFTVALTLALAAIVGAAHDSAPGSADAPDPVGLSLFGLNFAQLVIPILGVLATAGEYTTGMVRASMTAVPRRLPVLWGKAAVFGAVVLGVTAVTVFAAFPLAQAFLSGTGAEASLGDPGVVRALSGGAAAMALTGVLGLGLGALLRSIPAGVGVFVIVLSVLPQLATSLPYDWVETAVSYTPVSAGEALMSVSGTSAQGEDFVSKPAALLALCCWAAVALLAAGERLRRQDV